MRSPTSPRSPETAAAARTSRALLERYAVSDAPLDDLLAYKERDDRARQAVMDQLIQDGVKQEMGYSRR